MTESNMFAHIYNALVARLESQVPEIDYIAQDFGQLEVNIRPMVNFPAVLFDLEAPNYSDVSGGVQLAEGLLTVRVADNPFQNDSNLTPDVSRDRALKYYDLSQKVFLALQNFGDDYFGEMTRVSEITEKREDALRVRIIRFSLAWKDDSALSMPTAALGDPNITAGF